MANEWAKDKRTAATPVTLILALIILYGFSQYILVQCKGGIADCESFITGDIALSYSEKSNAQLVASLEKARAVTRGEREKLTDEEQEELKQVRKLIAERYSGRLRWVFL